MINYNSNANKISFSEKKIEQYDQKNLLTNVLIKLCFSNQKNFKENEENYEALYEGTIAQMANMLVGNDKEKVFNQEELYESNLISAIVGFDAVEHAFKTKDYSQNRFAGRVDYQLIYVYKGAGHYWLNNERKVLGAGNILLFRPKEPQIYSYYANEHPEIYWIHFTGNNCKNIIEKYNLHNCYIGEHTMLKTLFQETIIELQLKKPFFEDVVLCNFLQILAVIARYHQQILSPLGNDFSIDRLIMQLNQRYKDNWNVTSMAEK